ncbi:MAG: 50S ribosomal protein L29 [Spirochaetia bacterium]|nr:50S ribosomal protein L29 [Spirochaetota bacterium]MCX8097317.1 50S ribosomal protein L29 [Spirochaetota bacterium]MDW8112834.1 50S ribosomal protein L29 [Spirochaetia bacterium]
MSFTKKTKQLYQNMKIDELKKELEKFTSEYTSMIISKSTKQPDNPMKIRRTRRLIALIKTLIREKELGIRK